MFLYLLFAVVLLIYFYFKKSFNYWKDRGFTCIEPSFPMGSLSSLKSNEHFGDFIFRNCKILKNKGPAIGIYMFARPGLIITDPELVKDVTTRNFEHFHERGMYVNEKTDPLWNNLFSSSGQHWKDMRAKLSPTFTSGRMKMMFPIVAEAADRMVEYLSQLSELRNSIEMKEIYASYGVEVIANVAFGLDIKCIGDSNNEFKQIAKAVFEPTKLQGIIMMCIHTMPKIAKFFNMSLNPKHITDFFIQTVRETLEHREKNNIQRNDFFQLLMNIKNSEIGMSFNELAANSFIFFVAGFETSSGVMTFFGYELALNQDIQDRLRKEIEEVLEKHNGEVTYEAIMEMKYLDMVFNETMRKYPVVDIHNRQCSKDFKIPNTDLVIPAGTLILIPSVYFHNDEQFFENPTKFDPERFNDENVHKIRTYMPFSEGHRICIGSRFGTMQVKIGMLKILRKFRILPTEKTPIPMKFVPSAFQSPLGGMWLKLEKLT